MDLYPSLCTKTNSKWIKASARITTYVVIYRIQCRKGLFKNRTPYAQELRPTIDKWDFRKLRGFLIAKERAVQ